MGLSGGMVRSWQDAPHEWASQVGPILGLKHHFGHFGVDGLQIKNYKRKLKVTEETSPSHHKYGRRLSQKQHRRLLEAGIEVTIGQRHTNSNEHPNLAGGHPFAWVQVGSVISPKWALKVAALFWSERPFWPEMSCSWT